MKRPKQVRFAPRRFVRDSELHLVDPCLLSGRQLVRRRQQSIDWLVTSARSRARLAAAIEQVARQHGLLDDEYDVDEDDFGQPEDGQCSCGDWLTEYGNCPVCEPSYLVW